MNRISSRAVKRVFALVAQQGRLSIKMCIKHAAKINESTTWHGLNHEKN